MRRLLITSLLLIVSSNVFAVTYYVCGTVTWNGSVSGLYTTPDCSSGGPSSPTLSTSDQIIIQSGATVIVQGTVTANVSKITVLGTLFIGQNPGITPTGKLELPSNSATVELASGSNLGCYNGSIQVNCATGSTQIEIGTGGSKFTYNGGEIDNADALPKPSTMSNTGATPIVLSYFNLLIPKNENRTLIEWGTSSEENFSHFEIQRAGKDLYFNTILEVQGAGYNTNSLKEYSAYDENPLIGIGYYRLKAVDIDGSYEYFKVKSVNHGGGRRLLVSPNPTTGNSFTYSINWDPGLYDRISLLDAIGNEVYSAPVTALQNELQINKTLRPGAYLLRYTGPSFQEVTRVFIKD